MANLIAWRLVHKKHADEAFTGEGARLFGGRWNSKGTAIVYLADSPALCQLEILAHTRDYRKLEDRVLFRTHVDAEYVEIIEEADLPENWNARPPVHASKEIGDVWVQEQRSLLLRVPSVLDPHGYNYLLNPEHTDRSELEIDAGESYPIDERLADW